VPALRGFGYDKFPIWPLTAAGFAFLAFGFLASMSGRSKTAGILWLVPAAIAIVSLAQSILRIDLGVDLLLFGKQVALHEAPHPGRPGINSSAIFLLLATAGYGTQVRTWLAAEVSSVLAAVALTLVGVAAVLTAFSHLGTFATRFFSLSLPAAIVSAALALAHLILYSRLEVVRLLTKRSGDWRTIRILLPAALLLPILPTLVAQLVTGRVPLPTMAIAGLATLANIAIAALIAYWAVVRIARGQAAMAELSEALDQTTVVLTDRDGVVTHWSGGCEQLYGWTAEEALGQNKYMLLRSHCRLEQRARGGRSENGLELVEYTRDGRELSVLEQFEEVKSAGRSAARVLKVTDITQRVAAIEALQVSEERLALATSAHELGVFEWDVRTGHLEWSPGTEQRLGLAPRMISVFETWRAQV
jgi:two-component system, LuxR family, sensor kinase FixL